MGISIIATSARVLEEEESPVRRRVKGFKCTGGLGYPCDVLGYHATSCSGGGAPVPGKKKRTKHEGQESFA